MESNPQSRHPARAKQGRSNSPLGDDAEADITYRLDRKRGVSGRYATNMKDDAEQVINPKSMKTVQVTPEHDSQLENDTDLQRSRTSSSTSISHSAFATSYGSNGSRTSHGTNDDPSKLTSSSAHNRTDDDALNTGSPQPPERPRRAEIELFIPRVQEPRNTQSMAQTTDRKTLLGAKAYIVASQHQEWSLANKSADRTQGGRNRSLDDFFPSTFVTLARQEQSKRSKRYTRQPEVKLEPDLAPSKGTEETESEENMKITLEEPAGSPTELEQSEKDMFTRKAYIIKGQENQTGKAELRSKTAGVVNDHKNELVEETAKTKKVEEEMTEAQKKIAERRARHASRPETGIYVPPIWRRTNAAGNAPAPSQSRTNNNRNSGREGHR
jgi:hypothetical protein